MSYELSGMPTYKYFLERAKGQNAGVHHPAQPICMSQIRRLMMSIRLCPTYSRRLVLDPGKIW